MHIKRTVNRACAAALCAALCLSLASAGTPAAKAERLLDRYAVLFEGESASYDALPAYGAVAAAWRENGLTEAAADVPVPLGTVAVSGKAAESVQIDGRTGLLLDESTGDAVFSVSVPQDGLYRLEIEYYPQGGSGQAIRRRIALDGKVPFAEAENACLYRRFVYTGDARYNVFGDQLSYAQQEERIWMTADPQDVDGKYAAPLLYGLTAGTHTLTLGFVDQPVVIGKITLKASEAVPGHAAVSAGYPRGGDTAAPIVLQAEDPSAMLWRSDSTLTAYCDTDPATFPAVSDTRPLNAVGGSGWSHGGQEIAYRFTVETAGCYRLSLRVQQSWSTGMNAYRQILIDGQIPFAELTEYPFSYARGWYTETLHGEDGEPYLFYLTPGEHTLTLRAVMASAVTQAIADVGAITDTISAVYRKILLITGAEPDVNYDYDLEKSIPDLLDTLDDLQERLDAAASLILGVSKKRPAGVSDLYMIRQQLREMRGDPDLIPRRLEDITNSLTTLGSLIGTLSSTPLGIDELRLTPEGQTVPQRRSTVWQRMGSAFAGFLRSFTRDYARVGISGADGSRTIDVWVSRGTEWATVITGLIENGFEQQYGIGVDLNVLPSGTLANTVNPLLLAITSGSGPDVVLGVDANTAVEYGVRGVALDLTGFSDFADVMQRFHPELPKAMTFLGKTYGLPETMNFTCMAYRKDIFSELSLAVPKTWREVYYQTLPVLYQNGMTMLPAGLDTYLYQYGGAYYTADGLDTALDTAEAHAAFAAYIAQFQDLGFPISANFFSRFRTGEMPIGFVDYAGYLQILTAAPELAGKWALAPVPGREREDGTIDRTAAGLTGMADMLLSAAEDREACWTFLKWWMSADTQTSYGQELESRLGASARPATAEMTAFARLPWGSETLAAIRAYQQSAVAVPNVLGGVITARAVSNAADLALYSGYTPREALETAVRAIRDELHRKQELYQIAG